MCKHTRSFEDLILCTREGFALARPINLAVEIFLAQINDAGKTACLEGGDARRRNRAVVFSRGSHSSPFDRRSVNTRSTPST